MDAAFVRELEEDATCAARYFRWMGAADSEALLAALARVKRDRGEVPDDAATELHRLTSDHLRRIPFATLSAMRRGWDPFSLTAWAVTGTTLIGLGSLVLAVVTAVFTYIYQDGITLVRDLEARAGAETRKTFSRLMRDIDQARGQADAALPLGSANADEGGSSEPQGQAAQFDLARATSTSNGRRRSPRSQSSFAT